MRLSWIISDYLTLYLFDHLRTYWPWCWYWWYSKQVKSVDINLVKLTCINDGLAWIDFDWTGAINVWTNIHKKCEDTTPMTSTENVCLDSAAAVAALPKSLHSWSDCAEGKWNQTGKSGYRTRHWKVERTNSSWQCGSKNRVLFKRLATILSHIAFNHECKKF